MSVLREAETLLAGVLLVASAGSIVASRLLFGRRFGERMMHYGRNEERRSKKVCTRSKEEFAETVVATGD